MSGSAAIGDGKDKTVLLDVDLLVLDPALQCRARLTTGPGSLATFPAIDPAVVEDYAAAMKRGVRFPHISVVEVGEEYLVVDGWHRVLATRAAEITEVWANVRQGDRRTALLMAIGANADHGKPRSYEDKRRAIKHLLMDAEWCQLSGRELGELAKVSHTPVDEARKKYGVKKGEVLTEARASLIDGEPTEAWRELLASSTEWSRAGLEQIRTARDIPSLLKAEETARYATGKDKASALRWAELAAAPWPWGDEDLEQAKARAATLDTEEDITAALLSVHGAELVELREVLQVLRTPPTYLRYCRDQVKEWAARPRLAELARGWVAKAEELQRKEEERRAKDPWTVGRAVMAKPPEEQAEALLAAVEGKPKEERERVLQGVEAAKLTPEARNTVYKDLVAPNGAEECPDPMCDGWIRPGQYGSCIVCQSQPSYTVKNMKRSLAQAAGLLTCDGYGLRAVDIDVVVDRPGLELLAELDSVMTGPDSLKVRNAMRKLPGEIGRLFDLFCTRSTPEILFVDPSVDESAESAENSSTREGASNAGSDDEVEEGGAA